APMPMRPTPTAAPSAPRPPWILPVISARVVIRVIGFGFLFCFLIRPPPLTCTVWRPKVFLVVLFVAVRTNQQREHRGEQHEDERLYEADEHLHEIERKGDDPRELWHQARHRLEEVFTRIDVPV